MTIFEWFDFGSTDPVAGSARTAISARTAGAARAAHTGRETRAARAVALAAVLAAAAVSLLIASPASAQAGGEPETAQPALIIGDGLVAGSAVLLEGGQELIIGEVLLPGDIVLGGTLINVASEATVVIVGAEIEFVLPGDVLVTLDPMVLAWRCSCRCGTYWRVLNVASTDCAAWIVQNLAGGACVDPNTGSNETWSDCGTVWNLPTP